MFSNVPVMLQHQDFQARHSDMLAAAVNGHVLGLEEARRQADFYDTMRKLTKRFVACLDREAALLQQRIADSVFATSNNGWQWPEAKISTDLRIRLPADYAVSNGPIGDLWGDIPGCVNS